MCPYRTSVKTTFLVWTPGLWLSTPSFTNTLVVSQDTPLESETYSWPCENTCSGRYTPTWGMVWPCDLLTVREKLKSTGNCFRIRKRGVLMSSDVLGGIRGIKTVFSDKLLVIISASIETSIIYLPTQSPKLMFLDENKTKNKHIPVIDEISRSCCLFKNNILHHATKMMNNFLNKMVL